MAEARRIQILHWLSSLSYNEYHNRVKSGVFAGTGQWLLSHPIFQKWQIESANSLLWLHGLQGSGKSSLVSVFLCLRNTLRLTV